MIKKCGVCDDGVLSTVEVCMNCAAKAMETVAASTNTQSDEIIAGIVAYINGRLADKHCEYAEKQWLYNIRSLCGNRQ
jgi:hypothetical protein